MQGLMVVGFIVDELLRVGLKNDIHQENMPMQVYPPESQLYILTLVYEGIYYFSHL